MAKPILTRPSIPPENAQTVIDVDDVSMIFNMASEVLTNLK